MDFGWPLLPVLGGYWFVVYWHQTRFTMKRRSGYHLFFWAAIAGVFLHIPGTVIAAVANVIIIIPCCLLSDTPPLCFEKRSLFTYPHIATYSFLSGFPLSVVFNRFTPEQEATDDAAADNGDLLELLLAEAIDRTMPVVLVLKSRRVHVGFALNTGIEAQDGEFDIALVPLVSGYQDPDTLVLKLTTYYPPQQLPLPPRLPNRRLQSDIHRSIVIPLSAIVSARIFDPDVDSPPANTVLVDRFGHPFV